MQVGQYIKQERKRRSWSMDDMCAQAGNEISKSNLSKIEAGEVDPGLATITKIAKAFSMSAGQFLCAAEEAKSFFDLIDTRNNCSFYHFRDVNGEAWIICDMDKMISISQAGGDLLLVDQNAIAELLPLFQYYLKNGHLPRAE